MTIEEFTQVIHVLEVAIGVPIHHDQSRAIERTRIYWELLRDLPIEALRLGAQRLIIERKWASFPQVAEIRSLAVEVASRGQLAISPAEAWAMAWRAAGRIDLEIDGSAERALRDVPHIVSTAMLAFGLRSLCYDKESPIGVIRAQFLKIFEQLSGRATRIMILPPFIREQIEAIGRGDEARLPASHITLMEQHA